MGKAGAFTTTLVAVMPENVGAPGGDGAAHTQSAAKHPVPIKQYSIKRARAIKILDEMDL